MQKLNLPEYSFRMKDLEGKPYIFDDIRKKFVRLTPEEWVRQNFLQFLIQSRNFSPALIAVEALVNVNQNPQRADLVVFDRTGLPLLISEFKAPGVKISQQTFDQVVRYNMMFKVKLLVVSNGLQHYCCSIDYTSNTYEFIPEIPDFLDLIKD